MPHMGLPRWSRHYELHRLNEIGSTWQMPDNQKEQQRSQYIAFMREQTKPIYTQGSPSELPNATPYPLDDILKLFGRRYFTSTIAYMMAHAIMEGVDEMGLWGVDMALQSERYSHQRACLEYMAGICDGRGIPLHIPPTCDILKSAHLYAYGQEDQLVARLEARKRHIQQQMRGIDQQLNQLQQAKAGFAGVLDNLEWMEGNWTNGAVNGSPVAMG